MIIGALGSAHRASVRSGGRVVLHEGTGQELRLDWWIGGDDRWYEPDREITTRQTLIRDLPIVSVAVRVPSGDAVIQTFATVQGPRELVVSQLENRSKVPFAVALVVSGPGAVDVTLSGTAVRLGGLAVVHLPGTPARAGAAPSLEELRTLVTSGGATAEFSPVPGEGAAAFLFPLTHTMTMQVAAIVGGSGPLAFSAAPVLSALPAVHDLADGWDLQLRRGADLRVAPGLGPPTPYRAALSSLLLLAEPAAADPNTPIIVAAALARALDKAGFHAEAGALIEDMPARQGVRGELSDSASEAIAGNSATISAHVIDAIARHGAITHDAVFARTMAPVVAGGAEFLMRKRTQADPGLLAALLCSPQFFDVAGDRSAAKQATKLLARTTREAPLGPLSVPPLPAQSAGATFVPEEPLRLSEVVRTHMMLAADWRGGAVDVLVGLTADRYGQPVDVRAVPTPWGRVSYAVRWHGERPAILWDCVAVHDDQRADDLSLACSRLGDWTATGAKGEALLPTPPRP